MAYLKLVRPLNLLLILFTQYMVRFAFLYPILRYAGFSLQLNEAVFAVFSLAFVFMAAGGYIINDYYDVAIDKVNKPEKVIIGNQIEPSTALVLYWIFSLLGLVMGCFASYLCGLPALCTIFFIYFSGLWFYSTNLKYQFLAGNIVVAFFLALVPLTAGIVELYADNKLPAFRHSSLDPILIFFGIAAISLFAFLSSLAREIVKDMEDVEGDKVSGCRTVPIVMGNLAAKRITQFFLLIMFFLLCYLQFQQWKVNDMKSFIYITCFIQVPLIFIIAMVNKGKSSNDFHRISKGLKALMVSGISYLFVFAYIYLTQ